MPPVKDVLFVVGFSGTGHLATANALKAVLPDVLTHDTLRIDRVLGEFDWMGEHFYNWCLRHRRIGLIRPLHRLNTWAIRTFKSYLDVRIRVLLKRRYRMVVSCIPWINHYLAPYFSPAPYVTVMSDFDSSPDHPWIQHPLQHVICPTPAAAAQASAFGVPADRIHTLSGAVLNPVFYQDGPADRAQGLRELGLDPARRTALVFFGGFMPTVIGRLLAPLRDWNLIVLSGLKPVKVRMPRAAVIGYTDRVPHFMRLADVLVGKPGPGVVAEAVQMRLPVVVESDPAYLLPQEAPVIDWITRQGIGRVLRSFADLAGTLEALTADDLAAMRAAEAALENRGVFEARDILLSTLAAAPPLPGL